MAEICCRVCCKTLLQKNYKDHLKAKHPKEDYTDNTPLGQKKLDASYFSAQKSKKRSNSSVDKKTSHDEVEAPTKTQRVSLRELEAYNSLNPVLEGNAIEPDHLPTERNSDESQLNITLEKLSNIP